MDFSFFKILTKKKDKETTNPQAAAVVIKLVVLADVDEGAKSSWLQFFKISHESFIFRSWNLYM